MSQRALCPERAPSVPRHGPIHRAPVRPPLRGARYGHGSATTMRASSVVADGG